MSNKTVRAMILAAGAGSRLDPLTKQLPKPLVPIANTAVMEHVLELLARHGINDVAANLYHLADKIPAHFKSESDLNKSVAADMNIQYVQELELSGDAGGLRACKDFFTGGTFVVLMGDIVTDVDLSFLIEQHRRKGALATIGLKEVENVEQFGIVETDEDGFIKCFKEKPEANETTSKLASIGIYVFEPEIFNYIDEDGLFMFGKQLFPRLLESDLPMLGVRLPGYWSDIGTIDSYKQTTFDCLDGLAAIGGANFKNNVVTSDTATILLGNNVTVGDGVEFLGHVVIGDNCDIGAGAVIADSIVWSDSKIGARCVIDDCVIAAGSTLCAGTHLEGEAVLVEVANEKNEMHETNDMHEMNDMHTAVEIGLGSLTSNDDDCEFTRHRLNEKIESVA